MSHTQEVQVEMKDMEILKKAAKNLGATVKEGDHKLYAENVTGTGVYLKGWKFPVVITKDGKCKYDNYNGNWGGIDEFNKLKQQYSLEAVQKQLRLNKMKASVTTNSEGQIVMKIKVAV